MDSSRGKSIVTHTTFVFAQSSQAFSAKTFLSISLHQPHQSLPVKSSIIGRFFSFEVFFAASKSLVHSPSNKVAVARAIQANIIFFIFDPPAFSLQP